MSIPDGFKLVYQSGHTDTYCNSSEHRVIGGGWAGINKPQAGEFERFQPYKCDCAKWAALNESMKKPV